jgi:adenylate cyclase
MPEIPESPPGGKSGPASEEGVAPDATFRNTWKRVKEHKVVQWTLAYLALAYTLLHGAEMLGGSLGWPHSLLRLFTLSLILLVPLVVVIAWFHGSRGQQRVSGTEIAIILILLTLSGIFLWRDSTIQHEAAAAARAPQTQGGARQMPAAPAASIAVLAFSDLSAGHDQAYFSDGIAEEILNVLVHVDGLKVASRTSSFQFRNSALGIPAIAERLGVRHVLEGSVRKAGDMVRITAQLIDATTDQHLWSETFDRPLSTASLFSIQDEIASTIVGKLATAIESAAATADLATVKADTSDVAAYDLYLRGRALFVARSSQNMMEARRVLKAAVAIDPKFARAWETLAAVLVVSEFWGLNEETDYQQAAEDAADTALRLDPHRSMALAVRAEAQFNQLPRGGKAGWDESFANLSKAEKYDALNATLFAWRGNHWQALGFQDRARQDLQRCLAIDPAYELCRRFLAETFIVSGRTGEALREYETGLANGHWNADTLFARAAFARGDRIGALAMLAVQFKDRPQLVRPLFRALADPRFSERDRQEAISQVDMKDKSDMAMYALWVLKAYEPLSTVVTDNPTVLWARDDPEWLRSKARKNMMVRWRLPEYWRKHGFPQGCKAIGAADFQCR